MLKRLVQAAPNLFTLLNLCCGVIGLVCIFNHLLFLVTLLVLLSGLFDFFDGKVARKLKVTSEFGVELDSLADIVSFGVVPAVALYESVPNQLVSTLALLLFPIAGALRLARFNTKPTTGFFEGIPITAAGIIVGLVLVIPMMNLYLPYLGLLLSILMVSKIRIKKF